MVQKYQNEIAPIFYYGKSPKTNEKDLKIPILQLPDWGQPYWMTRYIVQHHNVDIAQWLHIAGDVFNYQINTNSGTRPGLPSNEGRVACIYFFVTVEIFFIMDYPGSKVYRIRNRWWHDFFNIIAF